MAKSQTDGLMVMGGREGYDCIWFINNWRDIRRNEMYVAEHNVILLLMGKENVRPQTKWKFGFHIVGTYTKKAKPYCKLIEIGGGLNSQSTNGRSERSTINLMIGIQVLPENSNANENFYQRVTGRYELHDEILFNEYLHVGDVDDSLDSAYINSTGCVKISILMETNITRFHPDYEAANMEEFFRISNKNFVQTMATMFSNNNSPLSDSAGNVKVIASDGVEILANAYILKGRCPVFANMLTTNMSEGQSQVVYVRDVSGKTLEIILKYICSGSLSNAWRHSDIIVEFVYAVGKYQISSLLSMLDGSLTWMEGFFVTKLDTQLLCICGKLGLKNAEKLLLNRVVSQINRIGSIDEFFNLLGLKKMGDLTSEYEMDVNSASVCNSLEYGNGNTMTDNGREGYVEGATGSGKTGTHNINAEIGNRYNVKKSEDIGTHEVICNDECCSVESLRIARSDYCTSETIDEGYRVIEKRFKYDHTDQETSSDTSLGFARSDDFNNLNASSVLKMLDDLLAGKSQSVNVECNLVFLLLNDVQRQSLKNLENMLLEKLAEISRKFRSADELFSIFGYPTNE